MKILFGAQNLLDSGPRHGRHERIGVEVRSKYLNTTYILTQILCRLIKRLVPLLLLKLCHRTESKPTSQTPCNHHFHACLPHVVLSWVDKNQNNPIHVVIAMLSGMHLLKKTEIASTNWTQLQQAPQQHIKLYAKIHLTQFLDFLVIAHLYQNIEYWNKLFILCPMCTRVVCT